MTGPLDDFNAALRANARAQNVAECVTAEMHLEARWRTVAEAWRPLKSLYPEYADRIETFARISEAFAAEMNPTAQEAREGSTI